VHAETGQAPIDRFCADGPHRQADPSLIREAFRWSVTRRVTRVATVPLDGNSYSVDPALAGRRVELRYDPEDLAVIEVFLDGRPAGAAVPFIIGRHVHKAVAPPPIPAREKPPPRKSRPGAREYPGWSSRANIQVPGWMAVFVLTFGRVAGIGAGSCWPAARVALHTEGRL